MTRQSVWSKLPRFKPTLRNIGEPVNRSQPNHLVESEIIQPSPPDRPSPATPYPPEAAIFLLNPSKAMDESPPKLTAPQKEGSDAISSPRVLRNLRPEILFAPKAPLELNADTTDPAKKKVPSLRAQQVTSTTLGFLVKQRIHR